MHDKIVIVGGGAGGLELACKLGRKLGPEQVTLVDCRLYHVWKPSLHEVAAGTLDINQEGLSYQMLGHDNGFNYVYGPLTALDANARCLTVGAVREQDELIMPERCIDYDALVLAVGSTSNYFGIPGAQEHTIALNATEDAERFRLTLLKLLTLAEMHHDGRSGVDIVIIGGGATGVELAAELREASGVYAAYGFRHLQVPADVRITLIEGAPRILAPLPQKVADAALRLLQQRAIAVVTGTRVERVEADRVMAGGHEYRADICVWAAGIKAPAFLASLGLPITRSDQIEVDGTLAVIGHPGIYALGDCAACTGADGKPVPPRAQAAHQQADYLLRHFLSQRVGAPVQQQPYVYRDYGSLVSLGQSDTVGSLTGSSKGFQWFVEGLVARMMYASLHLLHHQAVLGSARTALLALARFLIKRSRPLVKLH